jgi:hypothetical protein
MIIKIDIPRPSPIICHKLLVSFWPLIFRVPRQHALQTHAYTLYVLDGQPPLSAEEVETDYAVRVDVWVHGYWAVGAEDEGYFWGFWYVVSLGWDWWGRGRGDCEEGREKRTAKGQVAVQANEALTNRI